MSPNKHRLNDLFISRLRPRSGAYLVWDTLQNGLAVLVQPTGHKAYKVIYTRHGRSRWYHLANAAAIDVAAARKLALKVMVLVADGADPAAERRASRGAGTFEDLAARHLKVAKGKNKSWEQADKLVKRFLLPRWGKLQAAEINRGDVKSMMSGIDAPILANQVLAAASSIFSWALREEFGGVKINPCVSVTTVGANATTIGEGQVTPISNLTLVGHQLPIYKALAILVMTDELLKLSDGPTITMFGNELRNAVAVETDRQFLSTITSGISPIASSGATAINILVDIDAALTALATDSASKLFIIVEAETAKKWAVKTTSTGELAFSQMSPQGGTIAGMQLSYFLNKILNERNMKEKHVVFTGTRKRQPVVIA